MSFLVRSGQVGSGGIGNAAVLSGSIGSGQIGSGHFASGLIAGLQSGGAGLVSGQVTSGFLGDNSVLSGNIGSGQVSTPHFASGTIAPFAQATAYFQDMLASITMSGINAAFVRVVSGQFVEPASGAAGIFPVVGLVIDNVLSGQVARVYTQGAIFSTKFQNASFSGRAGQIVFRANLGNPDTPGAGNIDVYNRGAQGVVINGSGMFLMPNMLSSGTVGPLHIASGGVTSGSLANFSVNSGSITSGQVGTIHFASGSEINYANAIRAPFVAEDLISGVRAVTININPSGNAVVRIAEPLSQGISNGAHWPAQGIVIDDVVSGGTVNVYFQGLVYSPRWSGNWSTNFTFNNPAWVNASGGIDTLDTISSSSGFHMPIGTWINASGLYLNAIGGLVASGSVNRGAYQTESIQSYAIASGAVQQFQLGDQAVLSGNLRSGLITTGARQLIDELVTFAGEPLSGGGAGALLAVSALNNLSGRTTVIAANPADPFRRPAFGVVTKNYASGDPVQVITHGVVNWEFSVNTNPGQPFFVGNSGIIEGINLPTTSGSYIQPMGWSLGRGLGGNGSGTILIQPMPWLSGMITNQLLGSGAVLSGNIGSGQIAGFGKSGLANARMIASGSVGGFDLSDASVNSGQLNSFTVARIHLASGTRGFGTEYDFFTAEPISGLKAVALIADTSLNMRIVRAERQSGLRLPAIGVTISGATSGNSCTVVTQGFIAEGVSGMIASGTAGRILYVGSGGLIVNTSGFAGGASSGAHLISGSVSQKIGVYTTDASGTVHGIFVSPSLEISSGVLTTAQGNF
jgi:hypothetical protein